MKNPGYRSKDLKGGWADLVDGLEVATERKNLSCRELNPVRPTRSLHLKTRYSRILETLYGDVKTCYSV
jgi:hypothetical protein